jgi:hypothetical protein
LIDDPAEHGALLRLHRGREQQTAEPEDGSRASNGESHRPSNGNRPRRCGGRRPTPRTRARTVHAAATRFDCGVKNAWM